jgi:hypothetical protein
VGGEAVTPYVRFSGGPPEPSAAIRLRARTWWLAGERTRAMTEKIRRWLHPITRTVPSAILLMTTWLTEAENPERPAALLKPGISYPTLMQQLSQAGKAADDRARAAAPAAGLLGTIAGLFQGHLAGRTPLVIAAAATIITTLFAQSARCELTPGSEVDKRAIEGAAYALRRKEAWSRLASYLAFGLAAALIVLSITS